MWNVKILTSNVKGVGRVEINRDWWRNASRLRVYVASGTLSFFDEAASYTLWGSR